MQELQEIPVYQEKKVKGDLQVMVVVPLVLLAHVVSRDWKERKVLLVLKARLVHQGVMSRDLKDTRGKKEMPAKKVTEDLMESL